MAQMAQRSLQLQLSPANTWLIVVNNLIAQVEDVMAITGKPKVNLIGHSHGGPTVLYVAQTKPEYIASITGVAGTYHGSKVADDIQGNKLSRTAFNILGDYIVGPLNRIGTAETRAEN